MGVKRRGSAVVLRVRRDLAEAGFETDPPSATSGIASVSPDTPILKAQSLMESHDYSQLAVMSGPRSLKGAISWESIAKRSLYDDPPTMAKDALDASATVVSNDEALLDQVAKIADAGYVFVKNRTNEVTGIVTAADLSHEFAQLANPFLLIGEIEGWLRVVIDDRFEADELATYVDPDDPEREIDAAANLTFGDYIRLFQDVDAWQKLGFAADRQIFCDHLDRVRRTRNVTVHPDGVLVTLGGGSARVRW